MNAQNTEKKPVIKRETKNKIRVDFERTPFKQRFKEKFLSFYFFQQLAVKIFWYILMIGISYIVLEPFITKILSSIMAPQDFVDITVHMVPKNVSFDIYRGLFSEIGFFTALGNTFLLSLSTAVLQTLICCFIGYGFAKFKFRGRNFIFMLVMLTMIIPHNTLRHAMYLQIRDFDIFGILHFLNGGGIELFGWNVKDISPAVYRFFTNIDIINIESITLGVDSAGELITLEIPDGQGLNLQNTYAPLIIYSLCGLAFKNGLYIFLLRQFFRGIPDELEESAYMDGCGTFRTFFTIILPLSIPMMVTVFLFAFCWQWMDDFYVNLLNVGSFASSELLVDLVGDVPPSLQLVAGAGQSIYETAIRNTCGLLIIAPLVVLYAFCQNFLVQGIEQSGLAN